MDSLLQKDAKDVGAVFTERAVLPPVDQAAGMLDDAVCELVTNDVVRAWKAIRNFVAVAEDHLIFDSVERGIGDVPAVVDRGD